MPKARLKPAPRPGEWIPLALTGLLLLIVGTRILQVHFQANSQQQLKPLFNYILGTPFLGFGAWLTISAMVTVVRLVEIGRATTMLSATIIEVRTNFIDSGHGGRQSRWVVVAQGNWPSDGTMHDFDSTPLRADVTGRFLPGQTVNILANVRSGVYRMDLTSVSGTARAHVARAMTAEHDVRPLQQQTVLAPAKGYAIFGPIVGIGALIVIFGGQFRAVGVVIVLFFGMILGFIRLGQKQAQQLATHGVVFPVTVTRIVHERFVGTANAKDTDDWSVSATGSWPDGPTQTFYGSPALHLGSLTEGGTVWVVGDPTTRFYELKLTRP